MGLMGIAAAFALAAAGSAIGIGKAGMSAIGAWKKCYAQNKPAPFLLLTFVGAPFTQTIYGMILMNALREQQTQILALFLAQVFSAVSVSVCQHGSRVQQLQQQQMHR